MARGPIQRSQLDVESQVNLNTAEELAMLRAALAEEKAKRAAEQAEMNAKISEAVEAAMAKLKTTQSNEEKQAKESEIKVEQEIAPTTAQVLDAQTSIKSDDTSGQSEPEIAEQIKEVEPETKLEKVAKTLKVGVGIVKTIQKHIGLISSSKPVGYGGQIVGAVTAITAAIGGGPIGAAVVGGIVIAGITASVIVDTMEARKLNKLEKENKLLIKHRDAKDVQEEILTKNPNLRKALENDLLKPQTEDEKKDKKSVNERYGKESKKALIAKGGGKALVKTSATIGLNILEIVKKTAKIIRDMGSITLIGLKNIAQTTTKAVFKSVFGVAVSEAKKEMKVGTLIESLKKGIDAARDKSDAPGYDNARDLKEQIRAQRIQTITLKALVQFEGFAAMSDPDKQQKFREIKLKVEESEKAIAPKGNFAERAGRSVWSGIKHVGRALSPYSTYNNISDARVGMSASEYDKLIQDGDKKKFTKLPDDLKIPEEFDQVKKAALEAGKSAQRLVTNEKPTEATPTPPPKSKGQEVERR